MMLKRLKPSLNFRFGFNFYSIKSINSLALDMILHCFYVLIFKIVRFSFNFFIITNLDLILQCVIGILVIINFNRYIIYVLFNSLYTFRLVTMTFSSFSGPRKARTTERHSGAAGRPGSHVKLFTCSKGRKLESASGRRESRVYIYKK